jgi:hypothetical protein
MYVAAQVFLDREHDQPRKLSASDNNDYKLGEMGGHNVVLVILPDGENGSISSAATVATLEEICYTAFLILELA